MKNKTKEKKVEVAIKKLSEFHFKPGEEISDFAEPFSKEFSSLLEKYGISDCSLITCVRLYDESGREFEGSFPIVYGNHVRVISSVIDQSRILRSELIEKFRH